MSYVKTLGCCDFIHKRSFQGQNLPTDSAEEPKMFLGRKIKASKWYDTPGFGEDEAPADVVIKELRTTKNALSFWQSEDGEKPWEIAARAICTTLSTIEAVDIAFISKDKVTSNNIETIQTPGKTRLSILVDSHIDVCNLDGQRLGCISKIIAESIKKDSAFVRLSKSQVKEIIKSEIDSGNISLSNFPKDIQVELNNN